MNPQTIELLSQGFALHQQGCLPEAAEFYQQVLAREPNNADALHLLGVLCLQGGDCPNAVVLLQKAVARNPQKIEIVLHLGAALAQLKRTDEAIVCFEQAQKLDAKNPVAWFNKGLALVAQQRYQDASAQFERATLLQPDYIDAINNLGNVHCQLAHHERAIECFEKVLSLAPGYPSAILGMAAALGKLTRFKEALGWLNQMPEQYAGSAEVHDNRGAILAGLHRFDEAITEHRLAIQLSPESVRAWTNLGGTYAESGQLDLAQAAFKKALELDACFVEAYLGLGAVLVMQTHFAAAVATYQQALAINPASAEAYTSLGQAHVAQRQFAEAFVAYNKAIELNPAYWNIYNNIGAAYYDLRQTDLALAAYDQALRLSPKCFTVLWNQSLALLAAGRYTEGWQSFEARHEGKVRPQAFDKPLWLGKEDISNCDVLLHHEQGLGDTLQFCRYVDLVAKRCRQVYLLVQKPAADICRTLVSQPIVLTSDDALPEFDVHCPLMSLPLALGTTVETIPAQVPYLSCDPIKVAYWQNRLGSIQQLRVGLVWNGGFRPDQPELWAVNSRRNIALAQLQSLVLPGVQFFSLQKGAEAEAELHQLKASGWDGPDIIDYVSELQDYTDTAALIENLDLVISVDTSVVHLAGALAKPVWVLNRYDSCWRWFVDRKDSPWYPTARIYNQPTMGDWDAVVSEVRADLLRLAEKATRCS